MLCYPVVLQPLLEQSLHDGHWQDVSDFLQTTDIVTPVKPWCHLITSIQGYTCTNWSLHEVQ